MVESPNNILREPLANEDITANSSHNNVFLMQNSPLKKLTIQEVFIDL